MHETRKSWFRGAITLGVLATFGTTMLVSNVAAVPEAKEASKKYVKKQIKKLKSQLPNQITQVGNPVFIEEDELIRFSAQMNEGAADQTLATVGPFTIRGACDNDGANFDAFIEITTSEANSALDSTSGYDDEDFDTAETGIVQSYENFPDAGTTAVWNGGGVFHAASPSGAYIQGPTTIFMNFDGFDCTFFGTISKVAPV
jgi:Fe-S cluster assembly scaffold protein SufB